MQGYIWLLWDIAAVLIIAFFIHNGAARGLVRTVVSLAGYLIALLAARFLSPVIAEFLYDKVVKDALIIVLTGRMEEALAGGGGVASELLELIPDGLRRIMDGDVAGILGAFSSDVEQLAETLVDTALRNPVLSILQALLFLVLFSLTLLLVRKLSWIFSGINRIPLIGTVNTLLGGVLGVIQAALAMVIGAVVLRLIIVFSGGFVWLNPQIIDDTYIWRVFYSFLA